MKLLIASALICASLNAGADSFFVHVGAWSQHFSGSDYNESHNLLAAEHQGYIAGYFKNSYGEDSGFIAKRFVRDYGHWQAGVTVGAVHGYRSCLKGWDGENNKRLCPLISPSITYTAYAVQPSLLVMGNAVAVSIRTDLSSLFGDAK